MISPKSCWYFLRRYKRNLRLKNEKILNEKIYWEGFHKGKNSIIVENLSRSRFDIGYLSGVIHTTRSLMKLQATFLSSIPIPDWIMHMLNKVMKEIRTNQKEVKFQTELVHRVLKEGIFIVKTPPVLISIKTLYTPQRKRKRKSKKDEPFLFFCKKHSESSSGPILMKGPE
eukprot:TRINITY_DN1671_c0_g1_i10.p1 TRINITY_DN1671_c0_g1~~TRINITY_DN1671_c0_g1_i10.p1  ORF type:complete len:171 (-),score=34.52 TRINITY_DN1671_c0_g1_i10:10-522(-)